LAGRKPSACGCIGGGIGIGIGIVASRRDLGGLGGIVASRRDSGGLGGRIVTSRRNVCGLVGRIVASRRDLGGLGGIVASRRDLGGLEGRIVASRRDVCGLIGRIVASGRDLSGVGGGIEGFGCVHTVAHFLGGTLGCNSYKAFLFVFDLPRQAIQVLKTLLPRLAEALARKEESRSF
jgi:hypothetical protein